MITSYYKCIISILIIFISINTSKPFSSMSTGIHSKTINGISFSPSGLLLPFHLGVASQLYKYYLISDNTVIAGASGGSIAAVVTCLQPFISFEFALTSCEYVSKQCLIQQQTQGNLRVYLEQVLDMILPINAHEIINSRKSKCIISYQEVYPDYQSKHISYFTSRLHLIQVILASCNIPFYFNTNMNPFIRLENTFNIDGFFASSFNRFGCPKTITNGNELFVLPFIPSDIRFDIKKNDLYNFDVISPLLLENEWIFDLQSLINLALRPPRMKLENDIQIEFNSLLYQHLFDCGVQAVQVWNR